MTTGKLPQFADERVNLKRDDAIELRRQANMLRDRLETYLADHPDFEIRKMLLSGSLAKGTDLKSVSDIDVACYVSSDTAPHKFSGLIAWLASRLEKAFPNFKPEQIKRKTYSVSVNFITTGNEVDIVPILYKGDPLWKGSLISQDTGEELMTSVPMHFEFLRKRKNANKTHFAQVVRLIKFWAKLQKQANGNFRFKSFMAELIAAHLADGGMPLNGYPVALAIRTGCAGSLRSPRTPERMASSLTATKTQTSHATRFVPRVSTASSPRHRGTTSSSRSRSTTCGTCRQIGLTLSFAPSLHASWLRTVTTTKSFNWRIPSTSLTQFQMQLF